MDVKCPKCYKRIILGLSDQIKKYGFVCPYCKRITSASETWEVIIHHRCNKELN